MSLEAIQQQLEKLHRDLLQSHPPEIMTTQQVAQYLSVTEETVFRWRKDGVGPKYAQPNRRIIRYLRDDVVAWMREHEGACE